MNMKIIYNGVNLEVTDTNIQNQILALCFGQLTGQKILKTSVRKGITRPRYSSRTHTFWSQEDIEVLQKSLENKHPINQIVKSLDFKFTEKAVSAMAYKKFPLLIRAMTGKPFGR